MLLIVSFEIRSMLDLGASSWVSAEFGPNASRAPLYHARCAPQRPQSRESKWLVISNQTGLFDLSIVECSTNQLI